MNNVHGQMRGPVSVPPTDHLPAAWEGNVRRDESKLIMSAGRSVMIMSTVHSSQHVLILLGPDRQTGHR